MSHNQQIGRWGEQIAADYLKEKGYEILGVNSRTPFGEIDIVALFAGQIFFVEVKTRTTNSHGLPEEALSKAKLNRMKNCAEFYAAEHEIDSWQCDAISINGKPNLKPSIEYFENVTR